MRECLSLHQIAECCGICHVTVCERSDNQLSVNIVWKGEKNEVLAEKTIICAPSCKTLHDLLIANGVELVMAEQICAQLSLD